MGGDLEHPLRLACRDVLGGIEDREVLPENLVDLVALDALGAEVPGRDVAARVEHENGVVPDALHEEAEALLRLRRGHGRSERSAHG